MKHRLSLLMPGAVALATAIAVTACSGSTVGGIGGLLLVVVAAILFSLLGGTACSDDVDPDADAGSFNVEEPDDAGDEEIGVGPCLSPPLPPPDAGEPEETGIVDVGPCLSDIGFPDPDAGDVGEDEDTGITPCLSLPPPDAGEDLDTGDVGEDEDTGITPCLSPPPPDAGDNGDTGDDTGDDAGDDAGAHLHEPVDSRDEILARMRDRLPEDVASRLEDKA